MKGERHHDLDELKKATTLNPRKSEYWNALAEVYLDNNQFAEAAEWIPRSRAGCGRPGGEGTYAQSLVAHRDRKTGLSGFGEAARLRRDAAGMQRLKEKAIADLHASEAKINQRLGGTTPATVVPWNEAGEPVTLEGELRQVTCVGTTTTIVIEGPDQQMIKLLLKDRGQLQCGAQKSHHVSVEYTPKPDAKLGTAGECKPTLGAVRT